MSGKPIAAWLRRRPLVLSVIVVLVILVPLGYTVVARVIGHGDRPQPFLERPAPQHTECVRDTEYMRYHHWELLRQVREEVVRFGKRGDVGLSGCRDCHTSRERFCNECHDLVSMSPDCFGCHYYP